jgi:hypothetical protein
MVYVTWLSPNRLKAGAYGRSDRLVGGRSQVPTPTNNGAENEATITRSTSTDSLSAPARNRHRGVLDRQAVIDTSGGGEAASPATTEPIRETNQATTASPRNSPEVRRRPEVAPHRPSRGPSAPQLTPIRTRHLLGHVSAVRSQSAGRPRRVCRRLAVGDRAVNRSPPTLNANEPSVPKHG